VRNILAVLLLVLLGMPFTFPANAQYRDFNNTGLDFKNLSEPEKSAYIAGFVSGASTQKQFPSLMSRIQKCGEKMTTVQMSAIVTKMLENNPEAWHLDLGPILFANFVKNCP
jgi:hypothetical protein